MIRVDRSGQYRLPASVCGSPACEYVVYFLDSSLTAATSISMILLCTNSTIVNISLAGANICDHIDNGM